LQKSNRVRQKSSHLYNLTSNLCDPTMPRKRLIKLRCPICKKPVKSADAHFPFCSERCRLIDLGKWASGGYVISSPVADADEAVRQDGLEDEDGE
jgi:endogenous inhibitor of DNA gyrase (YacG/DUF329 family)